MKKILLTISILSTLAYSNNLPVNIHGHFDTSYDLLKISQNDLAKAGLGTLLEDGYNSHKIITSLGVDVTYPIDVKGIKVKVGLGVDALFEGNISALQSKVGNPKNIDEKELAYFESGVVSKEYLDSWNNLRLSWGTAKEKSAAYSVLMKKIDNENSGIRLKKAKVEEVFEEHTVEDLPTLKAKENELVAKADEKQDEINRLEENINRLERVGLSRFARPLVRRKEQANEERVEFLRQRQEVLRKVEVLEGGPKEEQLAKFDKQIEDNENKKERYRELKEAYAEEARNLNPRRREAAEEKDKRAAETEEAKEGYYLVLENYYNSKNEPLSELPEIPEEVDYDDPDYEAKDAERERIKSEVETTKAERFDLYEKFFIKDYNNDKSRKLLVDRLNDSNYYGASAYGIVSIEKELTEDLSLTSGVKLGAKFVNNPLYAIGKELQEGRYRVDNSEYVLPESVSKVSVQPVFNVSVGLKYKGFRTEVYTGYNKGLVGLSLGYEF